MPQPRPVPADPPPRSTIIPSHTTARQAALVLTAASIALTATACGTSSPTTSTPDKVTRSASPTPPPEPTLTKKEALAQIAHYSKINKEANEHTSRTLLDTIDSSLSDHFRFTTHPEHGYVAEANPQIPGHLAGWLLTHEQFEPVPGFSGQYRLVQPAYDGLRRARQAARDLRRLGYQVHTAPTLVPDRRPGPPQLGTEHGLLERRARIAHAAATRSPQSLTAPATSPTEGVPQVAAEPLSGQARAAGGGRGR